MRLVLSLLGCAFISVGVLAQTATLKVEPVERQMPAYIVERLSPQDRVLFDKLMRVGLESAWSLVTAEGYPQNFINELSPLKPHTRMVVTPPDTPARVSPPASNTSTSPGCASSADL